MSSLSALEHEGRASQRLRERAPRAQDRGHSSRVGGIPTGGRLTLEQLLEGVWEGLSAGGRAACPVCRGEMRATAGPAGRCERCRTVLS